jgi:PAS domain S-box-containing protein
MDVVTRQEFGELVIDRDAHEVTIHGAPLALTLTEFILLDALARSPRRALSSEYLMRVITGSDWIGDTHALQVCVSRLRSKLGESGTQPRRIVTVHGFGYRFEPGVSPTLASVVALDLTPIEQTHDPSPAYILASLDRMIVWASSNITQLLGWDPGVIEGKLLYDLMHPDDRSRALAARTDLDAGHPASMMFRFQTSSGDHLVIEVLVRPIIGPSDITVAFLGELRLIKPELQAQAPSAITLGRKIHSRVTPVP